MGIAAGVAAAAAAGQLGVAFANSGGGGGGGGFGGIASNAAETPGFKFVSNMIGDNTIRTNITPYPDSVGNQLYAQYPNLFAGFGNLANQAQQAGNNFLASVGLGNLNSGQPISGLQTPGPGIGFNPNMAPIFAPLQAVENARQNAVSTLSDSLAKRGVLGSSFGGMQLAGLNSEFSQADANTRLSLANAVQGSQLATVQAVGQQIQNQQTLAQSAMQEEMNLLSIGAGQGQAASQQLQQNSQFQAQLAAQIAQGQGALAGFGLSQVGNLAKFFPGSTATAAPSTIPSSIGNFNVGGGGFAGGGNPFTFLGGGGETGIPSSIGNFNVGGGF